MASGMVPNTTWGDVFVAASHINKYLDPSVGQCIDLLMKHDGKNRFTATGICASEGKGTPRGFVRTSGFKTAKRNFDSVSPLSKGGLSRVWNIAKMQETYPFNEEFWGAATTYAIERSAAGTVPFWSDLVIESVVEAVKELPQTIGSAIAAVDPRQYLPRLSLVAQVVKWTALGGSAFLIYWYVLGGRNK